MDTLPEFRRTIAEAGLEDVVVAVVGPSPTVAAVWGTPLAFLFIDGGHGVEPARADRRGWTPHVAPGGTLAIHDVFPGPADGGRPPYEEIYLPVLESGLFVERRAVGSLRILTRTWQILSRGLSEIAQSGNGLQAAEMVLIRLAYAADLPSPDELIEKLNALPPDAGPAPTAPAPNGGGQRAMGAAPRAQPAPAPAPQNAPQAAARPMPQTYAQIVALAGEKRDIAIKHALEADLKPVAFEVGRIEVALTPSANPAVLSALSARLKEWTGRPWLVTISTKEIAAPTLREARQAAEDDARSQALEDPMVRAVLETFPGARLVNIKTRTDLADEGEASADEFPPDPEDEP